MLPFLEATVMRTRAAVGEGHGCERAGRRRRHLRGGERRGAGGEVRAVIYISNPEGRRSTKSGNAR
jgi:hypothetical protein